MDGCAVGPKDMQCMGGSFGGVTFTSLDKGLANSPVLLLNNAIHVGVVWGDVDVANTILVHKPVKGGNIGCAIVGDDFFNGTPPAQDVLKKKCIKGVASFCA
jgi:hypothetical protein